MSIWIAVAYIIGTILIALVSPFLGFVGLAGSIFIRFQDRFEAIAKLPTFLVMALACGIGFALHRDKLGNGHFLPDKAWAAFACWVFIGLLLMTPMSLPSELKFLFSSIVMYFFASRCLTTEFQFKFFFLAIAGISVAMGYEAMASYLTDPESPFAFTPNPQERRMFGIGRYANANEFGALMVMPISFLFGLILLSRSWIMRLAYLAGVAVLLYATALTYSRTCMAIVGLMAIVFGGLWGQGNVIKRFAILGIIGFSLLLLLTMIPGPIQERFMSILNFDSDESFLGRTRAWAQGWHMVKSYPIFGVGMNQWLNYHGLAPHNSFIQVLAETAFLGLFIFLAALGYSLKTCLRVIEIRRDDTRYDPRARILAITAVANLVGFCCYAFFGNQGYTPFFYLYSGICAGVANLVPISDNAQTPVIKKNAFAHKHQLQASGLTGITSQSASSSQALVTTTEATGDAQDPRNAKKAAIKRRFPNASV